MDLLNQLFATFKVSAEIFHNGQYCGSWAVDTSGSSYISFHVVTHGRCFLRPAGEQAAVAELQTGDLVLFPRDASHVLSHDQQVSSTINSSQSADYTNGVNPQATGLVCGYFCYQHPLIKDMTTHLPDYILVRQLDSANSVLALMLRALLEEAKDPAKGSMLILAKIAEALLAGVFRDHLPAKNGLIAAIAHPKLNQAMKAIHASPQQKWSVEQLAELCHLSRAGFADLFKEVVGKAPMEYLTQWRLSLAYRLLADDKISVLHAALESGYDNESSFSKAFKRVMGVTPGAVRAA